MIQDACCDRLTLAKCDACPSAIWHAQEKLSQTLGVADSVDFCVSASAAEVRELLGGAVGGLHSMVDEHFGISIVEYMAAGKLLPAGPCASIFQVELQGVSCHLCPCACRSRPDCP